MLLPLGKQLIIDYIMDEIDKLPDLNRVILITNSRFAGQFEDWASSCDRSGKAPVTVLDDGTTNNDNRLGAIGDINKIQDLGKEIGRQCQRLGVHVDFAPVLDVNVEPKNPIINIRSYGEDKKHVVEC